MSSTRGFVRRCEELQWFVWGVLWFVCLFVFLFSSRLNVVKNWSGLFRDPRYPSTSLSISKAARVGMENLRYPWNDDDNKRRVVVMIEVKMLAKPRNAKRKGVFLCGFDSLPKDNKSSENTAKIDLNVCCAVCILWKSKYLVTKIWVKYQILKCDIVWHNNILTLEK